MHLNDRLTIDEKRRTHDGYLTVNARVARAGNVQLYTGAEVGKPEMATVRVYRPADEVFDKSTMESFAHRPVTFGHPSQAVSAANWRDVAKGWSDGEVARDGEFIRVSMLLADADTIAAVENGTRELSMGYDCTLDWTSGQTAAGEAYDAIQRGIRSNHIAVVEKARGGAELRIGDSAGGNRKELRMMTDAERQIMRDSVRGMPLDQATALPLFDDVRGSITSGMPAEQYFAIGYGAVVGQRQQTADEARAEAAYDQMVTDLQNGHRRDQKRDEAPQYARDGRLMDTLPAHERAREELILQQTAAWQR
ncbi:DUF2213 domain-containing protein [Rhizobium leguminosarum]|uniref:DUF2213 domain-containing protein n=1 Tax=Rhizobium leguminosarum TaxID=384 RepID=A0A7K3VFX6_RHILE|nr:DUF2213 domain-containing protein [Rhizobium leguminosarum]NEK15702.1 DUF2213 domain-containing protein [Rhizobium leguminosarum]